MLNILNYRKGFASNSSSTHSVWISKGEKEIETNVTSPEFGWGYFICSDRRSIIKYLAAQVAMNIESLNYDKDVPDDKLKKIIDDLIGEEVFLDAYSYNHSNCYVDHQSVWNLPREKDFKGEIIYPSKKFVQFVKDHLLNNNVVILGGNDNDENECAEIFGLEKEEDIVEDKFFPPISGYVDKEIYCVNDGDIWKFFNKKDGTKTTFSDDGYLNQYDFMGRKLSLYGKSSQPELIDLIITNKCNENCSFCYRGCTEDGESANLEDVRNYIHAIQELDTFEVAIGGGDILKYPNLGGLIALLRDERKRKDLIFNTTLKFPYIYYSSSDFYKEERDKFGENLDDLAQVFSGIAFSIFNKDHVKSFIVNYYHILMKYKCEPTFQIIPELIGVDTVESIFKESSSYNIPIVMLGYKKTSIGRESDWDRRKVSSIKNENNLAKELARIADNYDARIDTQLIKNLPKIKDYMDIRFYRETEGTHSCCLDAVKGILSVSSYDFSKDVKLDPYNPRLSKEILEGFQSFNKEPEEIEHHHIGSVLAGK